MRKALFLLTAGALLGGSAAAEELTLDEVLANHFEAIGGLAAWRALESARFTGTMTAGPGIEAPFTMTFKRPKKVRLEFTVQGMTGIQAYDGETAWMIMPFLGKNDPELMPEDQAKTMRQQADLEGPLVDYEKKGHQVELIGLEEIEGTEAYKLKLTLDDGDIRYQYLDSEYFVVIKQEGKTEVQGQEVEFESTLSDYKEVDGLMFPHSIESRPKGAPEGQVITIDRVEIHADVPDDLFVMPGKAPQEEGEGAE